MKGGAILGLAALAAVALFFGGKAVVQSSLARVVVGKVMSGKREVLLVKATGPVGL